MRSTVRALILAFGLSCMAAILSGCEFKNLYVFEQMRNDRRENTQRARPDERPIGEAPADAGTPTETTVVDGSRKRQPVVFLSPKPSEHYANGQPELMWVIDPELGDIESVRLDIYPAGLERPYYMWLGKGRKTTHVVGADGDGEVTWYFYYGRENGALPEGAYVAKILVEGKRTVSAKTDFVIQPAAAESPATTASTPERK